MLNALRKYIEKKTETILDEEEFSLITSCFIPRALRKKQYLLQEGDICRSLAFVNKGCLRMYRADTNGIKHIMQFAVEDWWILDRESAINKTPSVYNIDAIEDSKLLLIDIEKFNELSSISPVFGLLYTKVSQANVIALEKRIHVATCYTAEEKYGDFIKTYPEFINRIPLNMIASFLGVTPETLSRIRKQYNAQR